MGNCCSQSVPHNRQVNDEHCWEESGDGSVLVNVYDLNDSMVTCNWVTSNLIQLGGAFHAGVEVYQSEWSYGTEGIFKAVPRNHEYHVFNQSVHMGNTRLEPAEVQQILRDMAPIWGAGAYDLMRKNCCTFADDFCRRLGVGPLPAWVNRLAQVGARTLLTVQQIAASLAPAGIGPEEDGYELLEGGISNSPKYSEQLSIAGSIPGASHASSLNTSPMSVALSVSQFAKYAVQSPLDAHYSEQWSCGQSSLNSSPQSWVTTNSNPSNRVDCARTPVRYNVDAETP